VKEPFIHYFFHSSLNKYILSASYVTGPGINTNDIVMNEIEIIGPCHHKAYILMAEPKTSS
jgi:hypothetical protein